MLHSVTSRFQAILLVAAVALAYFWLQVPALSRYSLQIFAATVFVFFVIKRLKKAKLWHVLPESMSLEMALVTFAFLLLIGATGNIESHFYVLTYIHLFLLTLTTRVSTAISTTVAVMEKTLLAKETAIAESFSSAEHNLETFITDFLKPKLRSLQQLAAKDNTSAKEVATQVSLLESEADKVLSQVRGSLAASAESAESTDSP